MKYCGQCGTKLNDDARFCANCGAKYPENKIKAPTIRTNRKKTKQSLILGIPGILLIIAVGIFLIITLFPNRKDSISPVNKYCWDQVSNYSIHSENEDGTVTVELTAPDYVQLIQDKLFENHKAKISVETLAEEIKNHPSTVKTYVISSNSDDAADIQVAFSDQIAKELALAAIGLTEFTEEWSDGQ